MARARQQPVVEQVTESEKWGLPTRADFIWMSREEDALRLVVRGWQWIEGLLTLGLADLMPQPDVVELSQLSVRMKIDLCVAMGVIRSEDRGHFLKMNALRNKFVHHRKITFIRTDARELISNWSNFVRRMAQELSIDGRSKPIRVLHTTLVAEDILLERSIAARRDRLIHSDVVLDMMEKVLGDHDHSFEVEKFVTTEYERRRKNRRDTGLL